MRLSIGTPSRGLTAEATYGAGRATAATGVFEDSASFRARSASEGSDLVHGPTGSWYTMFTTDAAGGAGLWKFGQGNAGLGPYFSWDAREVSSSPVPLNRSGWRLVGCDLLAAGNASAVCEGQGHLGGDPMLVRLGATSLTLGPIEWSKVQERCQGATAFELFRGSVDVTASGAKVTLRLMDLCGATVGAEEGVSVPWGAGGMRLAWGVGEVWQCTDPRAVRYGMYLLVFLIVPGLLLVTLGEVVVIVPLKSSVHYWQACSRQLFMQAQMLGLAGAVWVLRFFTCALDPAAVSVLWPLTLALGAFHLYKQWKFVARALGRRPEASSVRVVHFVHSCARTYLMEQVQKLAMAEVSAVCFAGAWHHLATLFLIVWSTTSWVHAVISLAVTVPRARQHGAVRQSVAGAPRKEQELGGLAGLELWVLLAHITVVAYADSQVYLTHASVLFFPSHGRLPGLMLYCSAVFAASRDWMARVQKFAAFRDAVSLVPRVSSGVIAYRG